MHMSNFVIRGTNGMCHVNSVDYLLRKRIITLEGEINNDSASEIVRQLLILGAESPADITIVINSEGGSTDAGLNIIDVINMLKNRINCVCIGQAASMAAKIFSYGDRRLLLPHSHIFLHQVSVAGSVLANCDTLSKISRRLYEYNDFFVELLVKNTGRTKEEVEQLLKAETLMTAEEAVDFGIADGILTDLGSIMEVAV